MKIYEILLETINDKIWYHSTTKDFDQFSNVFTASQLGIHLGNKDQALWRLGDEPGYLLSAKVEVRNLIRLKDEGSWYGEAFVEQLKANPKTSSYKWYSSMSDRTIRDILVKFGYDGVIYKNKFEGEIPAPSIIVFDASKIKIINKEQVNEGMSL